MWKPYEFVMYLDPLAWKMQFHIDQHSRALDLSPSEQIIQIQFADHPFSRFSVPVITQPLTLSLLQQPIELEFHTLVHGLSRLALRSSPEKWRSGYAVRQR